MLWNSRKAYEKNLDLLLSKPLGGMYWKVTTRLAKRVPPECIPSRCQYLTQTYPIRYLSSLSASFEHVFSPRCWSLSLTRA